MKSLIFKLFFTVLGGLFILLFAVPWNYFGLQVPFSGPDYKLGLDLQGGIELDYQVDLSQAELEEDYDVQRKNSIIEWLKSIIDKRVESLNINDSVITSASYGNEEHIIVQIPLKWNDSLQSANNIERAKTAIWKVVKIEFKELRDEILQEDIDERTQLAESAYDLLLSKPEELSVEAQRYVNNYENVVYGNIPDLNDIFTFTWSGANEITFNDDNISTEPLSVKNTDDEDGYLIVMKQSESNDFVFIGQEPSIWKPAQDSQGRVLNDMYFTKASVQYNEAFQAMVELTFNTQWAEIFGELTRRLVWQPMAIFVWWEMLTAPTINEPILSWRAVVTGNYTPESANKLATDINTWVVPAPIYLTSERTIDARLWQDSLEKIILAGFIGFTLILVFLVFIYRVSGLISAIALFTYIVITLAILKQFWIVLTLASIAWLVLSIGIAIDANILIFERMKDEIRKGKTLREAQRIWFDKSFSAIWDANITGLIVAIILFIFWINLIKWFGFILALWIIVSLFSVFFISRLFIRLLARTKISKENFIGK